MASDPKRNAPPVRFRLATAAGNDRGWIVYGFVILAVVVAGMAFAFGLVSRQRQQNTIDGLERTQVALLNLLTPTVQVSPVESPVPDNTNDAAVTASPIIMPTLDMNATRTAQAVVVNQQQTLDAQQRLYEQRAQEIVGTTVAEALTQAAPAPDEITTPFSIVVWVEGDPVVYAGSTQFIPLMIANTTTQSLEITPVAPVGIVADSAEGCAQNVRTSAIVIGANTLRSAVYCPPLDANKLGMIDLEFHIYNERAVVLPIEIRRDALPIKFETTAAEFDVDRQTKLAESCPALDLTRPFYPLVVGLETDYPTGNIERHYQVNVNITLPGVFVINDECVSSELTNDHLWEFAPGESQKFIFQPVADDANPASVPSFTISIKPTDLGIRLGPVSPTPLVYIPANPTSVNFRAEPSVNGALLRSVNDVILVYPLMILQVDGQRSDWIWYQVALGEGLAWVRSDTGAELWAEQ